MADQEWHYAVGSEQRGPVGPDEIRRLVSSGTIGPATLVWAPSLTEWKPLSQTELAGLLSGSAAATPSATAYAPPAAPSFPGSQPAIQGPGYETGQRAGYVGFVDAIKICFSKYATFRGRATRPEYWWFFLFSFLANLVAAIIPIVNIVVSLALVIPSLAAGVRRLHDTDRSGWWMFAPMLAYLAVAAVGGVVAVTSPDTFASSFFWIPASLVGLAFFVLGIVILVFMCLPGTQGRNRFG